MNIQPPRKILIPMDDSDHSFYTFDWFMKYFLKDRDHVFLFHCNDPDQKPLIVKSASSSQAELAVDSTQIPPLDIRLKNLVSENRIKGQVIIVESKTPGEAIVKAVGDNKIDVIVMGTQGEGVSARTSVGKVCAYVMNNAFVPTVVCRLPINALNGVSSGKN